MEIEHCLLEQFLGDFLFDGINEPYIWIKHICLASVVIRIEEVQ